MLRLNGHRGRLASAIVLSAFLALPGSAADTKDVDSPDEPAIPPGQEALLLDMLGKGAALPNGCKLADGRVEYTVVEATYDCSFGEVVMELSHPSQAIPPATETQRFAISVLEGAPPQSLSDALVALVRSQEGDFEWVWPAGEDAEAVGE